jgi:hypothetical protein
MIINCHRCGKEAKVKKTVASIRFCGRTCYMLWRAANRRVPCQACGRVFLRQMASSKYCSLPCRDVGRSGDGNHRWNGYLTTNEGYLRYTLKHPEHPNKYGHWVVWHNANPGGLCRCGREVHHVHHIDHDTLNNDISNLRGMCGSCHHTLHRAQARGEMAIA